MKAHHNFCELFPGTNLHVIRESKYTGDTTVGVLTDIDGDVRDCSSEAQSRYRSDEFSPPHLSWASKSSFFCNRLWLYPMQRQEQLDILKEVKNQQLIYSWVFQ